MAGDDLSALLGLDWQESTRERIEAAIGIPLEMFPVVGARGPFQLVIRIFHECFYHQFVLFPWLNSTRPESTGYVGRRARVDTRRLDQPSVVIHEKWVIS